MTIDIHQIQLSIHTNKPTNTQSYTNTKKLLSPHNHYNSQQHKYKLQTQYPMKQKKLEMEQTNLESEKATCRKTQLGPR